MKFHNRHLPKMLINNQLFLELYRKKFSANDADEPEPENWKVYSIVKTLKYIFHFTNLNSISFFKVHRNKDENVIQPLDDN